MENGLDIGYRDNATDEGFDIHMTYHLFGIGLRLLESIATCSLELA